MSDTIVHRLFEQAKRRPQAAAYFERQNGVWHATSWERYAQSVRRAGEALIALGVKEGDRVCILGFNRPEWVLFDLGAMAIGAVPAGIYTTSSPEEVAYVVRHSGAPVVLVENVDQWEKIKVKREELGALKRAVFMRGSSTSDPLTCTWEEFLRMGKSGDPELMRRVNDLKPDRPATFIYTSGTTGPPKAVMLSHENLAWTAETVGQIAPMNAEGRVLSYLPLSHIAEQMVSIHGPITTGCSVYFAESIDRLADNLKDCRPTLFFGVPRIWEKFHTAIQARLEQTKGLRARIVMWARAVGEKYNQARTAGRPADRLLELQYRAANRLVFSKLKEAIGLDEAITLVSGAAPLSREIIEFFASLDIVVREIYGQSEGSGPTSFNLEGRTRFGSVGPALAGVDVRIADDGEVLVKGPNVFLGYFNDEAATKDALDDASYLHSGDLGTFDRDGYLFITGRKKDIIITAGGKNIAPKNIEGAIKNNPLVHEAVVIGDRRQYLTALISLDLEAAEAFLKARNSSERPERSQAIHDSIMDTVNATNATLARVEQIKKIRVLPRPLAVDTGELTPTLKVKRSKVSEHFASEIDALYAE